MLLGCLAGQAFLDDTNLFHISVLEHMNLCVDKKHQKSTQTKFWFWFFRDNDFVLFILRTYCVTTAEFTCSGILVAVAYVGGLALEEGSAFLDPVATVVNRDL